MQISHISREASGLFSIQQLRLLEQSKLTKFIQELFDKSTFCSQIERKKQFFSAEKRTVLVNALREQYGSADLNNLVGENVEKLQNENTFTVTTGHQLTLLGSPLYFIVKIMHVIKMTQELNAEYPKQHFVPVFWMASEDHDFEEIQSTNVFGKKWSVEYKQKGAVGRFSGSVLSDFKLQIVELFREENRAEIEQFLDAYQGNTLTEFTRNLVHFLFKKDGLIIIDGDDKQLKSEFSSVFEKELKEQFSFKAISSTNELLKKEGFKIQVNPREINLFWIEDGMRERIIPTENGFEIPTKGNFSESEILKLLKSNPECFSPNAVIRPLYQECILPNLAYIGGGGEISYWLQLKQMFDSAEIPFPLIQVRNSILWIDKTSSDKMDKLELELSDIFKSADEIKREFIEKNGESTREFNSIKTKVDELKAEISSVFGNEKALEQYKNAEFTRLDKQISNIQNKLVKHEKSKFDSAMKNIEAIKNRLFPNGGLQERTINVLSLASDGKLNERMNELFKAIEPFNNDLIVLREKV